MLAALVEDVFLLPEQVLDHEAVDGQSAVGIHPAAQRVERQRQHLGVEPRRRLPPLREQQLHLLPSGPDLVVALILVVREGGEVPHLVGQLAHRVALAQRVEQRRGAAGERALARAVGLDAPFEVVVRLAPRVPRREDVGQVPALGLGDVGTGTSTGGGRGEGGVEQQAGHGSSHAGDPTGTGTGRATLAPHDGLGEGGSASGPARRPTSTTRGTIPDEDPRGSQRLHPVQRWGPGGRGGVRRASGALRHRGGELRLRGARRGPHAAACASSTTKS